MRKADLRFDIEAFQRAMAEYKDLIDKMTEIKDTLERQLEDLESTSWKSQAGEKFQRHYEKTWKKNVETYTDLLTHLTDTLGVVKGKYESLYGRARELHLP